MSILDDCELTEYNPIYNDFDTSKRLLKALSNTLHDVLHGFLYQEKAQYHLMS